MYRIGLGFDIHRLVKARKLILGGVEIPFSKGFLGYSDADVLTHAICNALLGAAGLGDLGIHFPSDDPKYKGISSLKLLKKVGEMIDKKRLKIGNIDSQVLAEKPKLSPHFSQMKAKIAQTLEISKSKINIKAGTFEGLGLIGQEKAIAALATVLLEK